MKLTVFCQFVGVGSEVAKEVYDQRRAGEGFLTIGLSHRSSGSRARPARNRYVRRTDPRISHGPVPLPVLSAKASE
jgi:hypothetical protein